MKIEINLYIKVDASVVCWGCVGRSNTVNRRDMLYALLIFIQVLSYQVDATHCNRSWVL